MSKVMLDNWELSTCAVSKFLHDETSHYFDHLNMNEQVNVKEMTDLCWQNLLTSIILWDDVYVNFSSEDEGDYTSHYFSTSLEIKYVDKLFAFISSCTGGATCFHPVDRREIPEWNHHSEEMRKFYDYLKKDTTVDDRERFLLFRGIEYQIDSNLLGYNYLPHPRRAQTLHDSGLRRKEFDRTLYLEILDDDINEFLKIVNERSKNRLDVVHFPSLYKYISRAANSPTEELQVALELRQKKSVVQFRDSLNDLEHELARGNYVAYDASLKRVNEVCKEVTDSVYKKPYSFTMSLTWLPSLTYERNVGFRVKSGLHTTFLSDLARFSLTGK